MKIEPTARLGGWLCRGPVRVDAEGWPVTRCVCVASEYGEQLGAWRAPVVVRGPVDC